MINSLLTIYVEKNGTGPLGPYSLKIIKINAKNRPFRKMPVPALPKYISHLESGFTKTISSYDDSYEDVSFFCEWKSCDVFFFYRKA